MTTQQTGPRLTIAGTCDGCEHLRIQPRRDGPSRYYVTVCTHGSGSGWIPIDATGTGKATPAWCPELPAARLALARSVVAASQPSALDLVPPDEAAIHRRMGSTPIVDADALFGQELRVYPKEPSR